MAAESVRQTAPDPLRSELDAVAGSLREPASIPSQVAVGLRKLILTGKLRPGDRVVEWKIARQLGIGQPTAREALLILENEGLIQRTHNRGCSVTRLNVREIGQIYRVRIELEPLAAELAVENAGNWNPEVLSSAMERLTKSARAGDLEEWHQRDLEFHQTLWKLADNPFLERALSQISVPFFAFAELVFVQTHPRDLVQQAQRHDLITAAVLGGNKRQARQTTQRVLRHFQEVWLASAKTGAEED